MSNIHLSNNGFIVDDDNLKLLLQKYKFKSCKFRIGFIRAATASMIGDTPKIDDITEDIYTNHIISGKQMIKFPDYIINKTLECNKNRVEFYFKQKGILPNNYKINITEFKLTHATKTGAYINLDEIIDVVELNLNETHWQKLSRDYLSYYFEVMFKGKLDFMQGNNLIEKANINYTKIPILAFKSENALRSMESKNNSVKILKQLVKRETDYLFI